MADMMYFMVSYFFLLCIEADTSGKSYLNFPFFWILLFCYFDWQGQNKKKEQVKKKEREEKAKLKDVNSKSEYWISSGSLTDGSTDCPC